MAHSYHHLYDIDVTVLRYFTVYGPAGRPDLAIFRFVKWVIEGEPVRIYGDGKQSRGFTYVDDIVEGLVRVIDHPAAPNPSWRAEAPDPATSRAPYRIYNIGNNQPVKLLRYIEVLEQALGKKAVLDLQPMQKGDVPATMADVSALEKAVDYRPGTPVEVGIPRFVEWYRSYYKV